MVNESRPTRFCGLRPDAGITFLEVTVVIAILAIVFTIVIPRFLCVLERSKTSRMLTKLDDARGKIELFEVELGRWPLSLTEAYGDRNVPDDLMYCAAGDDANAGHGNEHCTFFDQGNPSGQNQHGGSPGTGFIVATPALLSPQCQNINFIYQTCCGGEPIVVECGEDVDIGHPGQGPFKGASCGEGTGKGKGKG